MFPSSPPLLPSQPHFRHHSPLPHTYPIVLFPSDVSASADRFTPSLTYFPQSWGHYVKPNFSNCGGTNPNPCTETLIIVTCCTGLLMNSYRAPKLGQSDLLYVSKLPAKIKWVWIGIFKPAEPHGPWHACYIFVRKFVILGRYFIAWRFCGIIYQCS